MLKLTLTILLLTLAATTATAQCAWNCLLPGAEVACTPLATYPHHPGEKIRGTVNVVFTHADGLEGVGGFLMADLSHASDSALFVARLPDQNYTIWNMNETADTMVAVLRDEVLGTFFPESCGTSGRLCEADLKLRAFTGVQERLALNEFYFQVDIEIGTGAKLK